MILRNRELVEDRGETVMTRRLNSDAEVLQLPSETFGLELSAEQVMAASRNI